MRRFMIRCHTGPATTQITYFETWASDINAAWQNARIAGLVPLAIEI